MLSVKIDGKDMYTQYRCLLASKTIGNPVIQRNSVQVPLRDGEIDITKNLSDEVRFYNRTITIKFLYLGENKSGTIANVVNYLHGETRKIIFDDEAGVYYIGQIDVVNANQIKHGAVFEVTVNAEPFKYDVNSSTVEWEWDSLDFAEGIINETGDLVVPGEKEVTLICRKHRMFPEFIVSAPMQMEFEGKTYNLKKGSQKLYRVFFKEGENVLKFTGTGTVSIDYKGAMI